MAKVRVSSFVKKGKSSNYQIPGTKVGIQNSQLLISSGISSFDSNLGGGLPVGSLIVIDEDARGTFSKILMKYFLAEGLLSNQGIYVGSKDIDPESFVNELPSPVALEGSDADSENIKDEEMTIAWRYQNMKFGSSQSINPHYIGHYFDLTRPDPNLKMNSEVSFWFEDVDSRDGSFDETDYARLFTSIKERLRQGGYLINEAANERKILRLGLLHIGSPIWSATKFIPRFLYLLRALLRNSFATCVVTIPFHLIEDNSLKAECLHFSDICIQLESFSGTPLEGNPALRDYNGFFRIVKWAAINGLINGDSQYVIDLAIKSRRRKLTIEKLHLPPELGDINEKEQKGCGDITCGSSKSKLLEF